MSQDIEFNPALTRRLEQIGLSPEQAPTDQQWQAFLERIDGDFTNQSQGMLILDRNFDNMIRHAVDGFFIHDTEGNIIDANRAACQMLGYSHDELLSLTIADFEMELEPGAIWDDMTVDEVFTVEGTHRRRDGSTYPVETRVGAFLVDDQKVILALCRDVSERKEAERKLRDLNRELESARDEAVRANRTKSAFLASMSHELRTPLNAIIGYSEFLIEEMEDADDTHYADDVNRILTAGHHLLSLINDILDLSKIEAGKVTVDQVEFCLREMLAEIDDTAEPLAAKQNNHFCIDVSGDPDRRLDTDVTKVRQILFNLIGNACKFTVDGTVELIVDAAPTRETVRFHVRDTGKGMTAEQMSRVFSSFEQADASTTRKFGGTGLGLAITKRYCDLLGGSIDVESTPGQGTTFSVELPVVYAPPSSTVDTETSSK